VAVRLFQLAGGTGVLATFHPIAGMLLRAALGHANAGCPEALFNITELDAPGIRDPTRGDGRMNNNPVRLSARTARSARCPPPPGARLTPAARPPLHRSLTRSSATSATSRR
jgi:hypothetical protein